MVIGAIIAIVVGVGIVAFARPADGDVIAAETTVAGAPVGDLTLAQAREVVLARARELLDDQTEVVADGPPAFSRTLSRRDLRPNPRIAAALDAADDPRGPWGRALARIGLAPEREVQLDFAYDEKRLAERIADIRADVERAPRDAAVAVDEAGARVVASAEGQALDVDALRRDLERFPPRIELGVTASAPTIDDAAAGAARRRANALLTTPPTIVLGSRRASLTREDVQAALGFRPGEERLQVILDPEILAAVLGPVFGQDEREPADASFAINGTVVSVVPSQVGRGVDIPRLATTLVRRAGRPATGARFTELKPELTTAEANKLRIREQIATFTTAYDCCGSRVTNIQRGAALIDGTIIPPDGTFSLNDALGERTVERGFVPAGQIVAGRLEDAIGGGVSQIATTTYNAAFFGGMEIIDHTPHQFYISRYPAGREATVSWGGPELVFRNDWPAGVLLKAFAGSNSITVTLYSSRLGRRVETVSGPQTDFVAPEVVEETDSGLPPGTRQVEQEAGGSGFTITYDRQVYVGDEVKRDEDYRWRYSPQNGYVTVGPPKRDPPPKKDGRPKDDAPAGEPTDETAPAAPEGSPPPDGAPAPGGVTPPATVPG